MSGDDFRVLNNAVCNNDSALIEELVKSGKRGGNDTDVLGRTPMHFAAMRGHVEAIETLFRLGFRSTNVREGRFGFTPIHLAVENGHVAAVEALARLGSDALSTATRRGQTLFHIAAEKGHADVIELLARLGCKGIDVADEGNKFTPLHSAAYSGNVACIEALVRLGSLSIDALSTQPKTPIGVAFYYDGRCNPEKVRVLKALGANTTLCTESLPSSAIKRINAPLDEKYVMAVRARVYFAEHSLLNRLLLALASPPKLGE